jgi:hypothetical protein
MSSPELAQLEMLAQVDQLIDRLRRWVEIASPWEPHEHCRALLRRLLLRIETLRVRLEAPLIVATFGGTGTGKSALVNALVGRDCTPSGRQRPTTTRPVLIAHPQTELELLGLPLEEVDVTRADTPLLRDIVIIDCPDPDTSETETAGSNLARLHHLLPFCDVLLYTSTQQKYRSARVVDELATAATGCRLVFVQTCADLDEDIRDDWRSQLDGRYQVPEIFFVDSLRALREQQSDRRPTGDFRRLQELLSSELAASHRTQIRRANLVDLVLGALDRCREHVSRHAPEIERLRVGLEDQQRRLIELMSDRLREELLTSRGLWERRLIAAVTQRWGLSPFSAALRVYNGLGGLIASAGLWRARSSAQMALVGAVQSARWIAARTQELEGESRLDRVAALGLDDGILRESQMVISGFVHDARIDARLVQDGNFDRLRNQAVRVEDRFLGDASRRIDKLIDDLATRHAGLATRIAYEVLLFAMLAYVIGWPAYNFFYAHPWQGKALIPVDFYIHGAIYVALWSGILVMLFTRRLRTGLVQRVGELARQTAESRLSAALFPDLEQALAGIHQQRERLEALALSAGELRREIAGSRALGAALTPSAGIPAQPLAVGGR